MPLRLDVVVLARHGEWMVSALFFLRESGGRRRRRRRREKEKSELDSIERDEGKKKKTRRDSFHKNLPLEIKEGKGEDLDRRVDRFSLSSSPTMAEHLASLFGTEKDRVNVRYFLEDNRERNEIFCIQRRRRQQQQHQRRRFRPPLSLSLTSFAPCLSPSLSLSLPLPRASLSLSPTLTPPTQQKQNSAPSTSRLAPAGTETAAPAPTTSPRSRPPSSSTTSGAAQAAAQAAAVAAETGLPPPPPKPLTHDEERRAQEDFEDFYEDVFEELAQHGELEALHVCDNVADHLAGSVYAQFADEDDAAAAMEALQRRFYDGRPIVAEFSPVTDFREATCRQYEERNCARGG